MAGETGEMKSSPMREWPGLMSLLVGNFMVAWPFFLNSALGYGVTVIGG